MLIPLLLQLAAAQAGTASSPDAVCDAVAALIELDLRVAGECRIDGVRDAPEASGDLPFRSIWIEGFDAGAMADLKDGLDAFIRVSSPRGELAPRLAIDAALDAFERAAGREPRLAEAAIAAAELAFRTRLEDDARRALAIADRITSTSPPLGALIAELRLMTGATVSVVAMSTPHDAPARRRVTAIALLLSDERADWETGDSLYFDAIRSGDQATLTRALDDRGPLGEEPAPATPAALAEWWNALAAEAAVSRAERLHVHFTRLMHAYAFHYDWPRSGMREQVEDVSSPFDARGLAYVRHGAPARVVRTIAPVDPHPINETWVYDEGWGGPFALHFIGLNRDWSFARVPGCEDPDWAMARGDLDPRLGELLLQCGSRRPSPSDIRQLLFEMNRDVRAQHLATMATQAVDLGLETVITARGAAFRMRDPEGEPELMVVAGVPIEPGVTDTLGRGDVFGLRLEAYAQGGGHAASRANRLVMRTTDVVAPGWASVATTLPRPAPRSTVRLVLRDVVDASVGAAMSVVVDGTTIEDDELAISDVVPIALDARPTIERYGVPLTPLPDILGATRFGLYFELYGLTGDTYRATIRARRRDAGALSRLFGRDEAISLVLDLTPNHVAPGVAAELLTIAAPGWDEGTYDLEVAVEAGGRRVIARRVVSVVR
ncbi:MAG TPA: hypothetical protein VF039_07820 [Longimicrobiales bacterium]